MTNRLAGSTSPYLLQHADNPVDWWPWGDAAFEEARRRDVPILLSVGYAACHWCHVMAHESFEDDAVAAYLNAHFVAVKVDREERPDVDAVYMEATTRMTGQGGWPMTVFCTPDGQPFYCGTYFPPAPRHGLPGFRQLLEAVVATWRSRRDEVLAGGAKVVEELAAPRGGLVGSQPPGADELDAAAKALARDHDAERGGFGGAPKFPPSMVLEFLLRRHARTGAHDSLAMVEHTCAVMARGGMYDQLGGGFARYAVDADWVVPHFEKMLYDNALLIRVYTHLWRTTGSGFARRIALESADFLVRELRTPEGGFASALDADSPDASGTSTEGAFYAWTPAQLSDVLGPEDGSWAAELFAVTEAGTFEHGMSVLQLRADPDDPARYDAVRERLFRARAKRTPPARDDKVVAAWNGLAIAALAEAGALFDRPDLVDAAIAAGDLLVSVHLGAAGPEADVWGDRLARTSRDGRAGPNAGVLEDYADVAEGFLALYAVTSDDAWLTFAGVLLDVVLGHFTAENGEFFDTADDAERLFRRPQDPTDNATPSGWTAAAGALLTYAAYTGAADHRDAAGVALGLVRSLGPRAPRAIGWGLAVAEAWLDGPREIAVVGDAEDAATLALRRVALMATAPGAVVAVGPPTADATASPAARHGRSVAPVALLRDRSLQGGRPAAYVCRHFVCRAPTGDPAQLAAQVGARDPESPNVPVT
ncbi:thioredoxin domain-containing protein [Yinghuangia sp. ASG 101]|uniref:thioredoxin domain-containing protein n=1 Tax=Yinghuangia sp. ASG 101 TaxID=2896848 RepID=UPI001E47AADB|nr:thioredoxin domain-containing protein [Yinghuangia sp. ASG 101]UGQ09381.1 thioredoxin domain-containing protein [Yinghuangia sp. ASG 101]